MSDTKKIILIGLPKSGKSTFIAAFWYLVDGLHNTKLTLKQLEGDRKYLDEIRDKWLTYVELERTPQEQTISMKLSKAGNQEILDLIIPDLSGETYREQWKARGWTAQFEDLILNSRGALLFLHPSQITEALRVEQAEQLAQALIDGMSEPIDDTKLELKEWDAENTPTQVKIVELLQFIEHSGVASAQYKITVVISAWDEIKGLGKTPTKWFEKQMPLLHQYLSSKRTIFPSQVYGISAQGASYTEYEKLAKNVEAGDRIQVVGEGYDGHDITIPLALLLEDK